MFSIVESFNKQNDRIYTQPSEDARNKFPRFQRGHHPESVIIWWGISYNHVTLIHFHEKGVKTLDAVYRNILNDVVEPLNETLFDGEHWVFQQDSAPGHGAHATQDWLERNVPDFIRKEEWLSGSPDLNPLDYKI